MAKLSIKVSTVIDSGPLVVLNHAKFRKEHIKGKKLEKLLAEADPDKIGFEAAAADNGCFLTFVFNRPSGKKGAVIEVAAKPDKAGLAGKIEGKFEVKLRTGAAPFLEKYGQDLDLRITSVTLNDGMWSGFNAYPVGVDGLDVMVLDRYFTAFPKVGDFSVA